MTRSLARVCGALLMAATFARADFVIVQKAEGGGQTADQVMKIKGEKARCDLTPQLSMIVDGAIGETVTLMHTGRTYLKVSAAQTKAMLDQLQKLRPQNEPAKLQPTGRKEKIGEYECEVFTANLGLVTVTYWIAKDYPNYQVVLAQLDKFQSGTISAMGQGAMPPIKDFPGMIMKTEMDLSGKKTVQTLVSVKEENVDAAIFEIPKGYKEVTSPELKFLPK
jgi:hypothetical protein